MHIRKKSTFAMPPLPPPKNVVAKKDGFLQCHLDKTFSYLIHLRIL